MHGLRVRADLPLHHSRPAVGPADLELVTGVDRPVPDEPPPGRTLARHAAADRPLYTVVASDHGYVLRFHRTCDFEIGSDLQRVRLHVDPTADRGLACVLTTGLLAACVLTLRGHLVLHASAVEVNGCAVAFVARSGRGKSTLATLACLAGARFVSDDVLRVDLDGDVPQCRLGATESRLRPGARELGELAGAGAVRRTADGRSAVRIPVAEQDPLPLVAVVLPFPSRHATVTSVQELTASEALLGLSACPRIVGWCDPPTRGQQFTATARLTSRVPVLRATVPWGPPFDPRVATALLEEVTQDARSLLASR